jgi:capping protein beta
MGDALLNNALNLMRRMPPSTVENSLAGLCELQPDLEDDLYTNVDQPVERGEDTKATKSFVLCDYNRDGDSYRSPWSNQYFPALDDGFVPSDKLRAMELVANTMFDSYRNLLFEGGISSVYFFDTESDGFGACWLIAKDVEKKQGVSIDDASWNSTHVFEVTPGAGGKFKYTLTTTVMISMKLRDDKIGATDLSGLRTMQATDSFAAKEDVDHVCNMGRMLATLELQLRNQLQGIYIQKAREVCNGMRNATSQRDAKWNEIAQSMGAALMSAKRN